MNDSPTARGRSIDGAPLTPGVNVDKIHAETGLEMAARLGYTEPHHKMVIEYALWRWGRGEEQGSLATFGSGGIDLTAAYAILAAARVGPTSATENEPGEIQTGFSISQENDVVTVAILPEGMAGLSVNLPREDFLAYVAETLGVTIQTPEEQS